MRLRNRESEALRSLYSSGVHCHRYSDDSDRSYLSIFAKLISMLPRIGNFTRAFVLRLCGKERRWRVSGIRN